MEHIVQTPNILASAIAEQLNISERMVRKHISILKRCGAIHRVGSNKQGYWQIKKLQKAMNNVQNIINNSGGELWTTYPFSDAYKNALSENAQKDLNP